MKKTDYRGTADAGSDKRTQPRGGDDPVRRARQWGGGSKGSKGAVTAADRANDNSSARS
ncbi:MAG TPA: hypothetical protein VFU20_07830 [Sphingomicrobium sp.]|nr:hypothetical protein [Sphingomicrobium sp.]